MFGLKIIEELIELTPFLNDLTSMSLFRWLFSSSMSKSRCCLALLRSRHFISCCLSDESEDEAEEIGVFENDMDDMEVGFTTRLDVDEREL